MGMGRMKNDGGWKDMLSRIGDAHPGSKVHDLYGNKSIKDIKTRQVLQKHHKKRQAQQKKGK
jgi:hypothetical protein